MTETLIQVPKRFTAGETVTWSKSVENFKASDGWTLTYYFRGPGSLDVEATADGQDFAVTITSTLSTPLAPGRYDWQAWVSKDGIKSVIDSGTSDVLAGLSGAVEGYDSRSTAKKILDAIDALVAGSTDVRHKRVTVSSAGMERTLESFPVTDLIGPTGLRNYYATIYAREQRLARIRKGGGYFQQVKSRFR